MTMRAVAIVIGVAVLGSLLWYGTALSAKRAQPQAREIRWLISHQPTDVFIHASKVFADELEKKSNGALTLKIVSPEDVGITAGDIPNAKVFDMLDAGDVELATTYTVALGKDTAAVQGLNLPFLFSNYAEAGRILDGAAGESVRDAISASTSAHALAFTMSGGFRIIASKSAKIESVDDMKGKRIATSGGPVAQATLEALGAIPVPTDLEGASSWDASTIDGVETTYSRLSAVLEKNTQFTNYINETNHSLFLTVILANDAFYDSLTQSERDALQAAALEAAAVEREDSIALGVQTREALLQNGSIVTPAAPAFTDAMRSATESMYKKFESQIGKDIIDALRAR